MEEITGTSGSKDPDESDPRAKESLEAKSQLRVEGPGSVEVRFRPDFFLGSRQLLHPFNIVSSLESSRKLKTIHLHKLGLSQKQITYLHCHKETAFLSVPYHRLSASILPRPSSILQFPPFPLQDTHSRLYNLLLQFFS